MSRVGAIACDLVGWRYTPPPPPQTFMFGAVGRASGLVDWGGGEESGAGRDRNIAAMHPGASPVGSTDHRTASLEDFVALWAGILETWRVWGGWGWGGRGLL